MAFNAGAIVSTLELDRDPFDQGLAQARRDGAAFGKEKFKASLDVDGQPARDAIALVNADLRAITGTQVVIDVGTTQARADIDRLKESLAGLNGTSIRLDVENAAALAGLDEVTVAVAGLRALSPLRVQVDVDAGAAMATILLLAGQLEALGNLHPRVDVDVDGIAAALAQVAALQAAVSALGSSRASVNVGSSGASAAASGIEGLSFAIKGLLTLLPLVAPLAATAAGGLAAMGVGAGVGIGAIAAVMLGVSGLSDAVGELTKTQKTNAVGSTSNASAIVNAQASLVSSERALQNARETAASSAQRSAAAVSAARQQAAQGEAQAMVTAQAAHQSLTNAELAEKNAVDALTNARQAATRSLQDQQFAQQGGAIAERRAVLQLQDATKALQATQSLPVDNRARQDAQLNYDQAKLSVEQLQVQNQRLAVDTTKAAKAGVEGSAQVVAAQQQVSAATQATAAAKAAAARADEAVEQARVDGAAKIAAAVAAQADQQRQSNFAVQNAVDGVASAQRALEQAQTKTSTAGVAGASALEDAMAKLTPAGQEFARYLAGLKPKLDELKATAQTNLLPGLQGGLEAAMPLLPTINDLIGNLAFNVGTLATRAGQDLNGPEWRGFFGMLRQEGGPTLQTFGSIFGDTMHGTIGLIQGALPIWKQMGDGLEGMTSRFAAWGQEVASGKNEKFNEFLAYVQQNGPRVVDLLGDIVDVGIDIGTALAPAGGIVLGFVDGLLDFVHAIPPGLLTVIATGAWAVAAGFLALGPIRWLMPLVATAIEGVATATVLLGTAMGASAAGGAVVNFGAKMASVATFLTGPWGIAIGLAATVLGVLWIAQNNADDAAKKLASSTQTYRDALMASNGEVDESVRKAVQKSLADQTLTYSGEGLLKTTDALGISQGTLTDAIIAGGKPLDDIRSKLQSTADAHSSFGTGVRVTADGIKGAYDAQGQAAADALVAIDGLSGGYRAQQDAAIVARAAINGITVEQQKQRDASIAANDALLASIGADLTKEQTALRLGDAQKRYNDAVAEHGPKSAEANTAANDLNRTYLDLIQQSGDAAAKQASMNGSTDTTTASLDAQHRKALELADTLKGPLPETLQRVIDGMSATELSAAGATIKIDKTGHAVAVLPGGKEIKLKVDGKQATDELAKIQQVLLTMANGVSVPIYTSIDPVTGEVRRGGQASAGRLAGGGLIGYEPIHFDRGGVVPGYAPGVDDVPAVLSRGEAVLVPELVREIGPANILAANYRASGRQPAFLAAGGVMQFADGGLVPTLAPAPAAGPAASSAAGQGVAAVVDPAATNEAAAAVTALADAAAVLTPNLTDATTAGRDQLVAAQDLVSGGLTPWADQLNGVMFPTLTEAARLTGTVDVDAVHALHATLPPLTDQVGVTAAVIGARMRDATTAATNWQLGTGAATTGVQGALTTTRMAMFNTAAFGEAQFNRLKAAAADPIRWVMNVPLGNPGLVGAWNNLNNTFALGKPVNPFVAAFAEGGPVVGAGGPTDDKIPAMLSNGEFVVQAAVAGRAGDFLKALNAGQAEALQAAGASSGSNSREPLKLALGGPVEDAVARAQKFAAQESGKPYIWGGVGPEGYDCSGFVSAITNVLRDQPPHRRLGVARSEPWPGFMPGLGGAFSVGGSFVHTAATLGGVNAESGGVHNNVAFGGPATGADDPQFPVKSFLPSIGGVFQSGGIGGGAAFDPTMLLGPALAPVYAMLQTQFPAMFGTSQNASITQGTGLAALDGVNQQGGTFLRSAFASSAGGGSGGAEQYRGLVLRALAMVGQPASLADVVLRRLNQESGGNPRAINNWDSNALAGHPTKGVMQMRDDTYEANRMPGLPDDIWDPLSNIVSSMRYAMGRYGTLVSAYNRAGGYANGGIFDTATLGVLGEDGPEALVPLNRPTRAAEVMSAAGLSGGDGAELAAALEAMTARIEKAVADARPINVHPREGQSEEGIAASVLARQERDRRLS